MPFLQGAAMDFTSHNRKKREENHDFDVEMTATAQFLYKEAQNIANIKITPEIGK
jgi:hypothetical protein